MSRPLTLVSLVMFQLMLVGLVWAAGKEHVVGQKGKKFSESEITVQVGDKVVFKNDDEVVHNVYCQAKGAEFNIKNQAPGTSKDVTFDNEGTFEIRCALHPKMKMTVRVKK